MLCQIGFQSFCQFTPRKQDSPSTAGTFEPDIRAQARDNPLVGATGMLFSEA
jgi:hypothetical protein